jgi:hypothetical protein
MLLDVKAFISLVCTSVFTRCVRHGQDQVSRPNPSRRPRHVSATQRRSHRVAEEHESSEVVERASISFSIQYAIKFAVIWLPCPSNTSSRREPACDRRVCGSNTVVSHSQALLLDVHPLSLVEKRHPGGAYAGIQAVLRCFALKFTSGGKACPVALTYPIVVTHSCLPDTTFQQTLSRVFTNTLEDWLVPTGNPDSSML